MDNANATRMVLTYTDKRIAAAVLKAAKRDYDRPDVRADFERWKKEQETQKARKENEKSVT